MKKLLIVATLGLMTAMFGCKSIPSTDQMYAASYSIGASAGLVANMTKIDDVSRNTVVDIINLVDSCIPEVNQSFTEAWIPIAQAHVSQLIENGKINAGQGIPIMNVFNVCVHGMDYLVTVRYPDARQYQELVKSAVHGFTGGLLTTFKPTNSLCSSPVKIDKKAYDYLVAKTFKNKKK